MSGLAAVATALGADVSGSDRADSPVLDRLRGLGVAARVGHDAAAVPTGDDVELVYSTAVPEDNPERAVAHERGLAELHRADLLAELTRLRPTIAVTGAHGKTTTAAMIVCAMRGAGLDPAYVVGGELRETGTSAEWRPGEWLVVEADESDRSLLRLEPRIAVLTNVELDHHTVYGSVLELEDAFAQFLAKAPQAVVWDRPGLLALRTAGETVAFDVGEIERDDGSTRFAWRGIEVRLAGPGEHNARNAVAALEASVLAGADPQRAADALAGFAGTGRRFQELGRTPSGALVYDDYAHHPTEVAATIAAARGLAHDRLVAVFQPHLYSRTALLAREFGEALAGADAVAVLDVYPARERAEDFPGVDGRLVAAAAADAAGGRAVYWLPSFQTAEPVLRSVLTAGDLCLVLGAGDVDALGRALVA
jgi:UDP-N-acetylmuramate--alanine ligase